MQMHEIHQLSFADSRSDDFFLMQTPPIKVTLIWAAYILMIKHGPRLMESRKPFDLKYIMMAYNLFQVITNLIVGSQAS